VNTKVPVVRGAVKTQVDAKGDRGPRWVVLATIEANLHTTKIVSGERRPGEGRPKDRALRTLFAGFDFNFSNILIDSCFDARAAIVAIPGGANDKGEIESNGENSCGAQREWQKRP
jgi:hypothetical protein